MSIGLDVDARASMSLEYDSVGIAKVKVIPTSAGLHSRSGRERSASRRRFRLST